MAKLSQAQVQMYAQSAGMPNPQLMAAIAMAESSGNTRAHNPLGLDNSYGLWQINMLGSMGPARRKQFGITRNEELFDPAVNARAAAKILSGQGLAAWSTYTNGAYKKYMSGGGGAGAGGVDQAFDPWDPLDILPGDEGLLGGVGEVAKGIGTIAEATVKTAQWLGQAKNWIRVGYVVGGALLAGMGLYIVASPLIGKVAASSPAAQTIKRVVPGSKGGSKSKASPKKESTE